MNYDTLINKYFNTEWWKDAIVIMGLIFLYLYFFVNGIMSLSLVFFFNVNFLRWKLISIFKRVFSLFLCAACLSASLIMHVPISELHAPWHLSLNSHRYLQFHLTVMLVVYVNTCFIIIRQNFLHVSFSSKIS